MRLTQHHEQGGLANVDPGERERSHGLLPGSLDVGEFAGIPLWAKEIPEPRTKPAEDVHQQPQQRQPDFPEERPGPAEQSFQIPDIIEIAQSDEQQGYNQEV